MRLTYKDCMYFLSAFPYVDDIEAFSFSVWKQNRHSIVGHHGLLVHLSPKGKAGFLRSSKCHYNMVLAMDAFFHRSYLVVYNMDLLPFMRIHVDTIGNCRTVALNFVTSYFVRRPPIKMNAADL